jgi:protein-S-isoprenylcysteine O-methyltransferase Ste14/pimeloyl-ACP methyl ester carboxylesterase
MFARALLAFVALPGLVAYLVPLLFFGDIRQRPFAALGLVPVAIGSSLLLWCVREFYTVGKGTLAPWQPPRDVVTSGPYRWSRNPMYVAVTLVLVGWALCFRTTAHWIYAAAVLLAFHVRVVVGEEPWLRRTYPHAWQRYAPAVPRWLFRTRTGFALTCVASGAALTLAGLGYEMFAESTFAGRFAAPGSFVDVGGRRLHLLCIGNGVPTVLFEASGWGNSLSASAARVRIAQRTTVCSYDRRGRAWSDQAPGPVTALALAEDLRSLVDRAPLRGPLVIVAASMGGITAEMYARRYPERVAGLVLLDVASSVVVAQLEPRRRSLAAAACTASALAQFGVIRLLDPFDIGAATVPARRSAAMTYDASTWRGICSVVRAAATTDEEFAQAPPLRSDVPLAVLSAASTVALMPPGLDRIVDVNELKAQLEATHRELARQSTRGTWTLVPESTHLIAESRPDAVAAAVFSMLDELAVAVTE